MSHSWQESVADEVQAPLARIIDVRGEVQVKAGPYTQWSTITPPHGVDAGYLVVTGEESAAVLVFSDGSRFEMLDETMIELVPVDGSFVIHFKTGQMIVQGESDQLFIQTQSAAIKTKKGAIFHLKSGDDALAEVLMKAGSAEMVGKNDEVVDLKPDKMVQVEGSGKINSIDLLVNLSEPSDGAVIDDARSVIEVPFKWTALSSDLKSEIFQISSSPKFLKEHTLELKAHQGLQIPVERGRHFWRVGWSVDKKTYFTRPNRLELKSDKVIELAQPVADATFSFDSNQGVVEFHWQTLDEIDHYVLEIGKDGKFSQIEAREQNSEGSAQHEFTFQGEYFWKVTGFDSQNSLIAQSKVRKVKVQRSVPALPRLLEPIADTKWTWTDPVKFSWEKDVRAISYKLLVSNDFAQKNIVDSRPVTGTYVLWTWRGAQPYFWSVTSIDKKGQVIGKSEVRKFIVTSAQPVMPITLLQPSHQKTIMMPLKDPMDRITFEWKAKERENGLFRFRLAEAPNFVQPLVDQELSETQFDFSLAKPGNYYWQVTRSNPDRPGDIERSAVQSLKYRISTYLLPPTLVAPNNGLKEVKFKKIVIDFFWQPVQGADRYQWVLEKVNPQTGKKEIFADQTVTNIEIQSPELLDGFYSWSVRALDAKGRLGTVSDERKFEVVIHKELVTPKLAKPKIDD